MVYKWSFYPKRYIHEVAEFQIYILHRKNAACFESHKYQLFKLDFPFNQWQFNSSM